MESYLLALLRCCRAVSFSERVSDNELAKNWRSATVDGDVLELRCPTSSEKSEGTAYKTSQTRPVSRSRGKPQIVRIIFHINSLYCRIQNEGMGVNLSQINLNVLHEIVILLLQGTMYSMYLPCLAVLLCDPWNCAFKILFLRFSNVFCEQKETS